MARLESCIAKGYITHKAMKFALEYCSGLEPKWALVWMVDEDIRMSRQTLPRAKIERIMNDVIYEQAHKFVLLNHPAMACWKERYIVAFQGTSDFLSFRHWVRVPML
jgi:hypothetical protein